MVTGGDLIPSRNVRFASSPRKALVMLPSRGKD
jgi:hypothetical protein